MTPSERLAAALETLRWSAQTFADVARINERTVRRWLAGDNPVPPNLLAWAESHAAHLSANPAPGRE